MSDYFSRRERVSLDGTDKEGSPYANTWEHALAQVTGKCVSGMWAWGRTCGVHGLWDKQVPNRKCHESLNGACLWISLNPQGLYQVYMPTSPMLLPWVVRMLRSVMTSSFCYILQIPNRSPVWCWDLLWGWPCLPNPGGSAVVGTHHKAACSSLR